jgi:hypothetical protein
MGFFRGADKRNKSVEEICFLLILLKQFVDFDIVSDDLLCVEG